ncbi:hypothetical protein ELH97_24570 (plasmid) [Rhizobium leguminosarum]|nr:hypothetical protein ELI05_25550 [Rhizobium leguminosarum]TAX87617.1 hypothetical protein ELH97_24570 [Rhizobium leguminosarum]TAX88913.1 hypothetical protein ELH94_24705 [Rhizobium leguminosarum]TAY91059.1 hypothetical protein ELH79_25635 [Rhizobium leguminosarum]TAZ04523.1 hypothetical protein ELH78_27355 [Rhizobium leguminosarum]
MPPTTRRWRLTSDSSAFERDGACPPGAVDLQRRTSFQTRKGRCKTLNLRIVLSENRFRFSGRCASETPDREANEPHRHRG